MKGPKIEFSISLAINPWIQGLSILSWNESSTRMPKSIGYAPVLFGIIEGVSPEESMNGDAFHAESVAH